jgi:LytS/YehU family sensor histidine kinase
MTDILQNQTVLLSKEIEKVKDQIELHRLLANGDVFVDFLEEADKSMENAMIPPSTLLTLVENIFRYGVVKDPDYRPSVSVKMEKGLFNFSTYNYKRLNSHPGTGMGIKSVASTLGYYYPGLHHLQIDDNAETFHINITIQL